LDEQVHADQLRHVKKGCLTRTRNDISSDDSRIEGSHKGWNTIQRSFASGLEVFCTLGHDFVLRRNIRVASRRDHGMPFITSTHGSHHVHLISHAASMWNSLLKKEKGATVGKLSPLPELQAVPSDETFGLVQSKHMETFGGLWEIKDEDNEENMIDLSDLQDQDVDDLDVDSILRQCNVDPALHFLPQQTANSTLSSEHSGEIDERRGGIDVANPEKMCGPVIVSSM
jgi:hypothetical protein